MLFRSFKKMPDCLQLTIDKIAEFHWLPMTCAYRLLAEGNPLPSWHPLLTGSRSAMHAAGQSIRNKVIHEGPLLDLVIDYGKLAPRIINGALADVLKLSGIEVQEEVAE